MDITGRVIGDVSLETDINNLKRYRRSLLTDATFKKLASYKVISAMILQDTIPEFKGLSLIEVAKCIIDIRTRNYANDAEMLEDTIDLLPTEHGDGEDKQVRFDLVFKVRFPNGGNGKINITIDLEMQQITNNISLNYDLVSRGIYYGAYLLKDSLAKGSSYNNLNKVYSIWLCNGAVSFEANPEDVKNKAIHRYGFRRYYTDCDKVVVAESNADLIEVIFVEIPKLRGDSENKNIDKLFYNTGKVINHIENNCYVNLTKIKREVHSMINWEEETKKVVQLISADVREEALAEGEAKGKAEGKAEGSKETKLNIIKDTITNCKNNRISKDVARKHLILCGLLNDDAIRILNEAYGE